MNVVLPGSRRKSKPICSVTSSDFLVYLFLPTGMIGSTALIVGFLAACLSPCTGDGTAEGVKRLWGVPDTTAIVGKLFNYSIPQDAFSGEIERFEVSEAGEVTIPEWLHFDTSQRSFMGVPTEKDVGQFYISVKAFGKTLNSEGKPTVAKDVFSIDVVQDSPEVNQVVPSSVTRSSQKCSTGESLTLASILVDADVTEITPKQRVQFIGKVASFLGISADILKLIPLEMGERSLTSAAIMAGPGNAKSRHKPGAVFQWKVGCSGNIDSEHSSRLSDLERAAASGSLAHTLGLPVVGWHVSTYQPHLTRREKRQLTSVHGTPVPAVVPTRWPIVTDGGFDEGDTTEDSMVPEPRIVPTMASPLFPQPSHHHRHHHGEGPDAQERGHRHHHHKESPHITASPTLHHFTLQTSPSFGIPMSTPILVQERPSKTIPSFSIDTFGPSRVAPGELTPTDTLMPSMTTTADMGSEFVILPSRTYTVASDYSSSEIKPTKVPAETEPPKKVNSAPQINHRIKKLSMTAGKVWKFEIPRNAFSDAEDGDTRNLKLIFTTAERTAVPPSSWIQFDVVKQMLYALPLEHNIGRHTFVLEAMDQEGASVNDTLDIAVRQHPSVRASHHEFVMTLRYHKWQFPVAIDWQIEVVKRLANLYNDRNESLITVTSTQSQDPVTIKWMNDTLPRYPCPKEDISNLLKRLVVENTTDVTRQLKKAMAPEFRVLSVSVNYLATCKHPVSSTTKPTDFEPMRRNNIGRIDATVGEILRYKVPEDTFYDFEDGSTRYLNLLFLTVNNKPPPKSSWIQFDPKSQEFYGLPFEEDIDKYEFQLVAMDSSGKTATDIFVVIVHPQPRKMWSIEFSLHIDEDYRNFSDDTSKKVLLAWKLAKLYGDPDPRYITVNSISKGSVVYAWTNNTLYPDTCPLTDIRRLVSYLFNNNGTLSAQLLEAMQPEFKIIKADAMPLGKCLDMVPKQSVTQPPTIAVEETEPATTGDDDIYITTIVPAVLIAVMLIVAAMVACYLYRRKRKGKMTMQDTSTFMNKGIPIIFADELEDKPDPAKPPVIMKEEKPPLAPPDYPRSTSVNSYTSTPHLERRDNLRDTNADLHVDPTTSPPYQPPPPPFTTSRENKNIRPKATPTYRQPPPYVPP